MPDSRSIPFDGDVLPTYGQTRDQVVLALDLSLSQARSGTWETRLCCPNRDADTARSGRTSGRSSAIQGCTCRPVGLGRTARSHLLNHAQASLQSRRVSTLIVSVQAKVLRTRSRLVLFLEVPSHQNCTVISTKDCILT